MTSISFDLSEVQQLKSYAVREKPYANRISIALAIQLLDKSDPYFNSFSVLDELDYLEGIRSVSCTKPAEQFKKVPLYPFWHKHFFSTRHLIRNLGIRWSLDGNGNKELTAMIKDVAKNHGEDVDLWPGYLAHRLVIDGFEERAKRGLTGDWIIYAQHAGENYYLGLATHKEGLAENARRMLCCVMYPISSAIHRGNTYVK